MSSFYTDGQNVFRMPLSSHIYCLSPSDFPSGRQEEEEEQDVQLPDLSGCYGPVPRRRELCREAEVDGGDTFFLGQSGWDAFRVRCLTQNCLFAPTITPQVQPDGDQVHGLRQRHQPSQDAWSFTGREQHAPGAGRHLLRECSRATLDIKAARGDCTVSQPGPRGPPVHIFCSLPANEEC